MKSFFSSRAISTLRTMLQNPRRNTRLDHFRVQTFRVLLDATLIFGLVGAVINSLTNLQHGQTRFVLAAAGAYLLILLIRFGTRQWSYNLRAGAFVGVLLALGLYLSFTKGTVGDGRIWLLVAALMAALLLSIRTGVIVLGIEIGLWILIWGVYRLRPGLYPLDHLQALVQPDHNTLWLNTGIILLSVTSALIFSLAVLLHYLTDSLEESQLLADNLKEEADQRAQVIRSLVTSEEKYRRLVEHSPTLIMELDRDLRVVTANQAMKNSLGVPEHDLQGVQAETLVDAETASRRVKIIRKALDQERIIRIQEQRAGRTFQSTYVPSPGGDRVQVISYDITLLKNTQEELLRYQEKLEDLVEEKSRQLETEAAERLQAEKAALSAQKLADLGMLTTGVAHELNSPLQSILTWSEVLIRRLENNQLGEEDTALLESHLHKIKDGVLRCSSIVSSLRYYAHTQNLEFKPCQLEEILRDTLMLTDHQFREQSIRIETEVDDDLPEFSCMRYQISQLLINLLINARDAVGQNGKITIRIHHHPEPGLFELRVADDGQGIPADLQEEIFKPFFTTKEVGEGTGLGLYIVSGIVEAHGGSIEVQSSPGAGTEFVITLPDQPPDDYQNNPVIKGRYSDMVN